jgi:hypothetical protein
MIAMGPSSARTSASAASTAAAVGDVGLHGDRGGTVAQVPSGPQRCIALQVEQRDAMAPRRQWRAIASPCPMPLP